MKFAWQAMRAVAVALIVAVPMLAATAPVASGQTVEDRLLQLEREMQNLERKVYRNDQTPSGYQVPSPQLAQNNSGTSGYAAVDRMNGLEQQMNALTGQIEELQNRVAQLTNRLDKLTTDLEFRVSQLEGGNSAGGRPPQVVGANTPPNAPGSNPPRSTLPPFAAAPPPGSDGVLRPPPPGQPGYQPSVGSPAGGQQATLPPAGGTPEQQYQAAFDLINAHNYPGAEAAMRAFVQRNPKHALASNAQFWLGETFYVRNDYQNAAVAYADGYKNYPKGNKAPDTLLKLGMSLSAEKKNQDACAVYDRLTKEFPQAPDLVRRRVVEERKRNRCG
ncbi:MAG: tol-pal system protein YbgF [Rhodospirillales bacterium]